MVYSMNHFMQINKLHTKEGFTLVRMQLLAQNLNIKKNVNVT